MTASQTSGAAGYRNIGSHTFEEFIEMARLFHNYPAPGLLIGGYMVEEARRHLPEGTLFEAISETSWCLPDAIQMLTPCTLGNGWVRVLNFGIYAMSMYDKYTGVGVRVRLDVEKLPADSELRVWFLKEKPKPEQDSDKLRWEIGTYGADILSVEPIQVSKEMLVKRSKGDIAICPLCGDAYPSMHGPMCRSCRGESPYVRPATTEGDGESVVYPVPENLHTVAVDEAVGKDALHDMTRIVPGESKGAAFRKGQTFEAGDLCRLQTMGRNNVYVSENEVGEDWVHENDCAKAFADAMSGAGVHAPADPHEGKVTLRAERDGLLCVDTDRLYAFNLAPGVMAASRNGWTLVRQDAEVAATRAIPLYLRRPDFQRAMATLEAGPVFQVLPLKAARAGVLITGDEVFNGTIEDRFEGIIRAKLTDLGSSVHRCAIVPDDRDIIRDTVKQFIADGCDLIITTAGLSVDPDDVTRHGLVDAGATDLVYGAPILPGAMTLVGRVGDAPLLGVPACALFFKRTSLDLLLPRLLAGLSITREDLARLGEGGMCLGCTNCSFPKCPFGK
jgi:formylmethanofuran dehydrogenase subunit E